MSHPLLKIRNHHTASCGDAPIVDGSAENCYVGYFENPYGVIGRFKTSHSWALQNQQRCECSVRDLELVLRTRGIAASQCFDCV